MNLEIDPIKYEVFLRRLATVLEEGRRAISMISGSPAIVEGGECMTSFFDTDGKGILTAAGTLFHVIGPADGVKYTIEHYSENPGINEGDQFFFCDPYIAGTHLMDQFVIKPIFYEGKRVAWVGTMTHTGDVGGVLRGLSMEIFHEGIRFRGIKIFEGGQARKDVFECITEQCRDPGFVTIDILARVAANNVCTEGFQRLAEKFGADFVQAASAKVREDAGRMMLEKLRGLPDGTWRERIHLSTAGIGREGKPESVPLRIECAVTKTGEKLTIDLTGTSPQNCDFRNATLAATRSCAFGPICSFLLYDIPWNPSLIDLITIKVPEGSFLNCNFPASCGLATECGIMSMHALSSCIAKILYAAGSYEYVNSSWAARGLCAGGFGPGVWYGGHNQKGGIVGQGTYDLFSGASGGAPHRDGVDTAGIYPNPMSCISDAEFTEMYWPLLFLTRRHAVDSGGAGKFRGGLTLQTIAVVYGSKDLTADFLYGPEGGEIRGFGLFGGYPAGNFLGDSRLILGSKEELLKKFSQGLYPTSSEEVDQWGVNARARDDFQLNWQLGGVRVSLPEHSILDYVFGSSGGYGDPIDRDPIKVVVDLKNEAISEQTAYTVYGVVSKSGAFDVDTEKTQKRREEMRKERLKRGKAVMAGATPAKPDHSENKRCLIRISEYLEVVEKSDGRKAICCMKCGNEFCCVDENYKNFSLRIVRGLEEVKKISPENRPNVSYQEYICPRCGTLLQVDPWYPTTEPEEPLWDIQIDL